MRVMISGGAGYVGNRLVRRLLNEKHFVVVYDAFYFGNQLPHDDNLAIVRGDIRDTESIGDAIDQYGPQVFIHLACISNDPSFELDESLSRTINYECFEPMVIAAKQRHVKRFIYCSTSSVYGISDAPDVREDHPLVPITLYNTYKAKCEPLLFKHQDDDFVCVTVRPSTICGYSQRQRLDLAVNILTNLAYHNGVITVYGGSQKRPNLHIEDMVDCYMELIKVPSDKIAGQTFNVGAGNLSIMALAYLVRQVVSEQKEGQSITIDVKQVIDTRSYQVNSDKIRDVLGFVPSRTIEQAVLDLCQAFKAGLLPRALFDDQYYNVKKMHRVWSDLYRDAPPSEFDPTKGHLSELDLIRSRSSQK